MAFLCMFCTLCAYLTQINGVNWHSLNTVASPMNITASLVTTNKIELYSLLLEYKFVVSVFWFMYCCFPLGIKQNTVKYCWCNKYKINKKTEQCWTVLIIHVRIVYSTLQMDRHAGDVWHQAAVSISPGVQYLGFQAVAQGTDEQSLVAVDDVTINEGLCNVQREFCY